MGFQLAIAEGKATYEEKNVPSEIQCGCLTNVTVLSELYPQKRSCATLPDCTVICTIEALE